MSEADISKEEYVRAFRQRLNTSQACHEMLVMMLARENLAQDLLWDQYKRQTSRSMLKHLTNHVNAWFRSQRKAKPRTHMKVPMEPSSESPWTIDAFYVVAENGTVTDVSSHSTVKE